MALARMDDYLKLLPAVKGAPHRYLWSSYDADAGVSPLPGKPPVD